MGFPLHWTKANGNIYAQLSGKDQKRIVKPIVGVDNILARSWWETEPDVPRTTLKKTQRFARIKRLGNAVVPLQARCAFEYLLGITRVKPKQVMNQLFETEPTFFSTEVVKKNEARKKTDLKIPTLFGIKRI